MNTTKFIRIKDVEEKIGLSRSTIYKKIAEGTFPRQISIGARAVAWDSSEVDFWVEKQIALSRKQPKNEVAPDKLFQFLEKLRGRRLRADFSETGLTGIAPSQDQRDLGVL